MKILALSSAIGLAALCAVTGCGGGGNGNGFSTRPTATPNVTPGATPNATPTATPNATSTPTTTPTSLRGQIAFVSQRGGNADIYLMDAQGNTQRPFAAINTDAQERYPSLSRDGSFIVWSSNRATANPTANSEIYFANADGSNQRQYTNDMDNFPPSDEQPVISPDGTKIAWTTTRGDNFNIAVMNQTGNNQVTLTGNNPGEDSQPAWTSDSQNIVFFSERANGRGLYIMDAQGNNQRALLTNAPGDATTFFAPAVSPNGNLLAVAAQTASGTTISLRNLDGTPASTTFAPTAALTNRNSPGFSPDGTRLIYTGFNSAGGEQIYSSNLDGSNETALTSAGRNFEAMFSK